MNDCRRAADETVVTAPDRRWIRTPVAR